MARTPSTMAPLGMQAPLFDLPVANSAQHCTLAEFAGGPGLLVMFISNHCPFVVHIREQLAAFGRDYQARGLGIVAIGANDATAYPQDGPDAIAREVQQHGYTFPYLFDETQEVAKAYGAACTPDFFLFDGGMRLVYRGQFDPSRPENGIPVTGGDLRAACDAMLAGRAPDGNQIPSIGCNIKWRAGNEPGYYGA